VKPSDTRKIFIWLAPLGAAAIWYSAHELGFYFSDFNCGHLWILPTIHVLALLACASLGWMSYVTRPNPAKRQRALAIDDTQVIGSYIGMATVALFFIVILWQAIATFAYSGCER
jgi:hypothetical protein